MNKSFILQLEETDGETENYISVENEFVLETVFALFKERNKDYLLLSDYQVNVNSTEGGGLWIYGIEWVELFDSQI